MSIEQLIADYQAKGHLHPQMGQWLLNIYRYEIAKHGNEAQARRVLIDLLQRTPEEHRQKVAEARAIIADAIACKLHPPIPTPLKMLQAAIGCIIGALVAVAALLVLWYGLIFLADLFFGTTSGRVRVPIKGCLPWLLRQLLAL